MKESSVGKPAALLVIYDKGYKFKYTKYYLRVGRNEVGSHPSSLIHLPQSDCPSPCACIINITSELATIQPRAPSSLYVPSNMGKKNLLVEIQPGTKYVVEMEKDFSICGRKAIMQVSQLKELLQIKGVANSSRFDIQREDEESDHTEQMNQNGEGREVFQPTIPLDDDQPNFQPTVLLGNTFEPTIQLDDQLFEGNYEATLPLDEPEIVPVQKKYESSALKVEQMKNSESKTKQIQKNHSQEEEVVSMPETLREHEMPETLRDGEEMPATVRQSQVVFPPTIQQGGPPSRISEIRKKIGPMNKALATKNQQKSSLHPARSNGRYYSSYPGWKQEEADKNIEDFDDLFGGQVELNSKKVNSLKSSSLERSLSGDHSLLGADKNEEQKNREVQKINEESQRVEQSQEVSLKKCCILHHKLTALEKIKLKEKGYEQVDDDQDEPTLEFQLLLLGELSMSNLLLMALIEGKQIEHINWISNQKAQIVGKLEGFPWESIYKRRGKKDKIFASKSTYYLQEDIREEYSEVMRRAGATLTDSIPKNKSRQAIDVVLNPKSRVGRQLYDEKKNYKKWSFYSQKFILESVLMGEQIKQKYRVDAYSF